MSSLKSSAHAETSSRRRQRQRICRLKSALLATRSLQAHRSSLTRQDVSNASTSAMVLRNPSNETLGAFGHCARGLVSTKAALAGAKNPPKRLFPSLIPCEAFLLHYQNPSSRIVLGGRCAAKEGKCLLKTGTSPSTASLRR